MYNLFFFIIGLACIVLSVLNFMHGNTAVGIWVMMIGISSVIRHGSEIVRKDGGVSSKTGNDAAV